MGVDLMDDIKLDVKEAREAPVDHPQWEFEVSDLCPLILNFIPTTILAITEITEKLAYIQVLF